MSVQEFLDNTPAQSLGTPGTEDSLSVLTSESLVDHTHFQSAAVTAGSRSGRDPLGDHLTATSTSSTLSLTTANVQHPQHCRDFSIARLLADAEHPSSASRISVAPLDLRRSSDSGCSGKLDVEIDVVGRCLPFVDERDWRDGRLNTAARDAQLRRQSSTQCHHLRLLLLQKCADDDGRMSLCTSTVDEQRRMTNGNPQRHSAARQAQGPYSRHF